MQASILDWRPDRNATFNACVIISALSFLLLFQQEEGVREEVWLGLVVILEQLVLVVFEFGERGRGGEEEKEQEEQEEEEQEEKGVKFLGKARME